MIVIATMRKRGARRDAAHIMDTRKVVAMESSDIMATKDRAKVHGKNDVEDERSNRM